MMVKLQQLQPESKCHRLGRSWWRCPKAGIRAGSRMRSDAKMLVMLTVTVVVVLMVKRALLYLTSKRHAVPLFHSMDDVLQRRQFLIVFLMMLSIFENGSGDCDVLNQDS